jgi:hypothetical protein
MNGDDDADAHVLFTAYISIHSSLSENNRVLKESGMSLSFDRHDDNHEYDIVNSHPGNFDTTVNIMGAIKLVGFPHGCKYGFMRTK